MGPKPETAKSLAFLASRGMRESMHFDKLSLPYGLTAAKAVLALKRLLKLAVPEASHTAKKERGGPEQVTGVPQLDAAEVWYLAQNRVTTTKR